MSEIIAFVAGILYRVTTIPSAPTTTPAPIAPQEWYKDEEWTNWSLAYGVCLFLAWFRFLRSFTLSKLGKLVGIFHAMFIDVIIFIIIYFVCLVACTMLFVGIASPDTLKPTCMEGVLTAIEGHPDAAMMHMECRSTYILMRTLFQSFGEFYLDEMQNTPSFVFLIVTFILLNVVLLNLLIAMMASTYERNLEKSEQKALMDAYDIARRSAYICISAPCPLNIVALILELCIFLIYIVVPTCREKVKAKFPGCSFWRKLELFLRRNTQPWTWSTEELESKDVKSERDFSACMVQARIKALEQGYGQEDFDDSNMNAGLELRIEKQHEELKVRMDAKFKGLHANQVQLAKILVESQEQQVCVCAARMQRTLLISGACAGA
jgi:hypothetical protein